jgi:hypothetical protein
VLLIVTRRQNAQIDIFIGWQLVNDFSQQKRQKTQRAQGKEWLNNKLPIYPCSFAATHPIFFVTMPHIAPQKIVDWHQNSGG